MKLKITYEYDSELKVNKVVGYSCVIPSRALYKYLDDNQIYVNGSEVPMSFYRNWYDYVVTEDNKIAWSGELYLKK